MAEFLDADVVFDAMNQDLEELEYREDTLDPEPYRADGNLRCVPCGFLFFQHPFTGHGNHGEHFLRRLCNGDIVKL